MRSVIIALLLTAWPGSSQTDEDRKRIGEFQDRMRRGEPGNPADQAYLKEFNARQRVDFPKSHPARESTGMIPLTALGKKMYKGEQGGLYPGGENVAPSSHLEAGIRLGRQVKPLDADGRPSAAGRIVMVSIGMSNTTIESQTFAAKLKKESGVNPDFLFVDCAQGGQIAIVTAKPQSPYWKVAAERLAAAGITAAQVQVAWLKQANAAPMGGFKEEAKKLQGDLANNIRTLHEKYPNLKLVYLSSRIYAGFASVPLNPEPYAYEGAFAVKWLIADQIAGNPELNYDPAKGAVKAPWLAWGPYLWADGNHPREDGLTYDRADFVADGTHPSPSAREKVADLLLMFLRRDPTSRSWFTQRTGSN